MSESRFDDIMSDQVGEANRDPGADLDAEGVPEVGDDSTPGKGEIPDPEVPVVPTDVPTAAMTEALKDPEDEELTDLEAAIAAEESDGVPDDRGGPAEHAALRVEEDEPPLDGEPRTGP
ncbi:hypothetical protein G1H11_13610 [Phytoactinopolyspora alkaliphila]|uniref:Uncharacterized protein n=1 Tax=Phytoactinopolyspora alkaliphila TaxID=1783498 RepID=A0A6N9YN28_9ACTN|nr:hypothetical protein [Phytoactinopolyspora alkaliphila]NED96345.1 hypothetical protein [Phytoactinopolyspora alkaliphila]